MNQCQEITLKGQRCKKGINCNFHQICSVCMDTIKNKIILDCGHKFCKDCINEWVISKMPDGSCPNCRTPITDITDCINWGLIHDKLFEAIEVVIDISSLDIHKQAALYINGIQKNKVLSSSDFFNIKSNIQQKHDYITTIFNEVFSRKQFNIVYFSKKVSNEIYHYYIFI